MPKKHKCQSFLHPSSLVAVATKNYKIAKAKSEIVLVRVPLVTFENPI